LTFLSYEESPPWSKVLRWLQNDYGGAQKQLWHVVAVVAVAVVVETAEAAVAAEVVTGFGVEAAEHAGVTVETDQRSMDS
jgi:hypothetical protein